MKTAVKVGCALVALYLVITLVVLPLLPYVIGATILGVLGYNWHLRRQLREGKRPGYLHK